MRTSEVTVNWFYCFITRQLAIHRPVEFLIQEFFKDPDICREQFHTYLSVNKPIAQ